MKMMLSEIARTVNGKQKGADVDITSVSIDTRAIQTGRPVCGNQRAINLMAMNLSIRQHSQAQLPPY